MNDRWSRRPDGSNWGDYGPDDQLGRLNLLTPERRRRAALEIVTGECFSLSLPLDYPGGNALNERRHPPSLEPTQLAGARFYNRCLAEDHAALRDVISDDVLTIHTQYSTQWDALSHVGCLFDATGSGEPVPTYYNGFRGGEHVKDPASRRELGDSALGIDVMARSGVQGRGVLIDFERGFGRDYREIGLDELRHLLDEQGIEIEEGDILCFHTGYADLLLACRKRPERSQLHQSCAALDGRDERLLQWLDDCGAAALVSDHYAVEHIAPEPREGDRYRIPLHNRCLFRLGMPLGELWYLSELRRRLAELGRCRFFLTAPPLNLPGAAGSPVTPVATI